MTLLVCKTGNYSTLHDCTDICDINPYYQRPKDVKIAGIVAGKFSTYGNTPVIALADRTGIVAVELTEEMKDFIKEGKLYVFWNLSFKPQTLEYPTKKFQNFGQHYVTAVGTQETKCQEIHDYPIHESEGKIVANWETFEKIRENESDFFVRAKLLQKNDTISKINLKTGKSYLEREVRIGMGRFEMLLVLYNAKCELLDNFEINEYVVIGSVTKTWNRLKSTDFTTIVHPSKPQTKKAFLV